MHLLLMYISHLFNHLAFILQDDYITRLFYSKHLLCFFIYFSSRFSTRNIWYVNLYIFLRCYKNFGMEISIWLSYYTKKNQSDFIFWLIFVSSVHFSSNRYAIGALAEDVFEKRLAKKHLVIRFKISYSNCLKIMYIQMWVFLLLTISLI